MLADVVGTSRSLKHGVFIGVRPDMGMRHEHCVEVVVFFFLILCCHRQKIHVKHSDLHGFL